MKTPSKKSLRSRGLIFKNLFKAEGALVDFYNRALEATIGRTTALKSFYLDKRGESPEIEQELGENYLQCGLANRYLIIVSPSQKDSDLLHEEFSFDNQLLDFIYKNYAASLGLITRVDSLYGRIEQDVRSISVLEDILMITKVSITLKTPSDFLSRAGELKELVADLQANPELLVENESAAIKRIHQLVSEVGDIREYNLSKLKLTKKVTSFYSRFFDGIYVFKNPLYFEPGKNKKTAPVLKVSPSSKKYIYTQTIVIYGDKTQKPCNGPEVRFISLQQIDELIDFLVNVGYAYFSYPLLESAMTRIEDKVLLGKGYDLANMIYEKRQLALSRCDIKMPVLWHDLMEIKRKVGKGYSFKTIMDCATTEVRAVLLQSFEGDCSETCIVNHLLTKLQPLDYKAMYRYNLRDLENIFDAAGILTQNYIIKLIS